MQGSVITMFILLISVVLSTSGDWLKFKTTVVQSHRDILLKTNPQHHAMVREALDYYADTFQEYQAGFIQIFISDKAAPTFKGTRYTSHILLARAYVKEVRTLLSGYCRKLLACGQSTIVTVGVENMEEGGVIPNEAELHERCLIFKDCILPNIKKSVTKALLDQFAMIDVAGIELTVGQVRKPRNYAMFLNDHRELLGRMPKHAEAAIKGMFFQTVVSIKQHILYTDYQALVKQTKSLPIPIESQDEDSQCFLRKTQELQLLPKAEITTIVNNLKTELTQCFNLIGRIYRMANAKTYHPYFTWNTNLPSTARIEQPLQYIRSLDFSQIRDHLYCLKCLQDRVYKMLPATMDAVIHNVKAPQECWFSENSAQLKDLTAILDIIHLKNCLDAPGNKSGLAIGKAPDC
ncbi:hypothetical protein NEDG_01359 [Nematocida displodere]|uniref:Uncharacterized protein n=1 Tax=Nematocida displodere TaxID=1805483 RepID=A0A177EC24_9MICR|nr:hypothetical protein NEDG_01359 [Nematocida displodere]